MKRKLPLLGFLFLHIYTLPISALAFQPLDNVAVLALNSVRIDNAQNADTKVVGDVIVNYSSTFPTLTPGFDLDVSNNSSIEGSIFAASINLDQNARISDPGNVFVDTLVLNKNAGYSGDQSAYSPPVIDDLPQFQYNDSPGLENVDVPSGVFDLAPGNYLSVTVRNGATLRLIGPGFQGECDDSNQDYNVTSITAGANTTIIYSCPVDVSVQGRFKLGKNSSIKAEEGSELDGSVAIFYVEGENDPADDPLSSIAAVVIDKDSDINANFYAPNGTIKLNKSIDSSGMLIGRDVWLNGPFTAKSAFVNKPPIADPQSLATDGANPLDILLTGSDPEGESLLFSLVSGPTVGSLGAITPIIPPPFNACSISKTACTKNTDCLAGETCDLIEPPVTSAEVTYTPFDDSNSEDSFEFKVTDPEGLMGTAVVIINPDDPSPPAPEVAEIIACGSPDAATELMEGGCSEETLPDTPVEINLSINVAIPTSDTVAYTIDTAPSNGVLDTTNLSSGIVIYTPNSEFIGQDRFVFLAADTSVTGSGTSDLGAVFVNVNEPPKLANDLFLETPENHPIAVSLTANSGGTGTIPLPSGSAIQADSSIAPKSVSIGGSTLGGSTIAGNVSATDGANGDGRDNLPGPAPVLVAAGVDVNLNGPVSGTVIDPTGDATNSPSDDPADPDLVSATVSSDGTNLSLSIRFEQTGFDSATSRGSFVLDIDENPSTGFPGIDAANNDDSLIGFEFLINIGAGLGATADVIEYTGSFTTVGNFPATVLADGYDFSIPLATLNGDDGRLKFKAYTQSYLGSGHTSILDYVPDVGQLPGQSRAGVQGVARIQIEWDISSLPQNNPNNVQNAVVTLTTEKGTVDSLDTMFYAGTADQNGTLGVTDFQAPVNVLPGVVMTVPPGASTGDEGTFSFNVTNALKSAIGQGFSFFSIQGRVDEQLIGKGFQRGLQIHSSADGNLKLGKEPNLDVVLSGDSSSPVFSYTILSITGGTLTTPTGAPVVEAQVFNDVTFVDLIAQPSAGADSTMTIDYQATNGIVIDDARIIINILTDNCVLVGRPIGCSPDDL